MTSIPPELVAQVRALKAAQQNIATVLQLTGDRRDAWSHDPSLWAQERIGFTPYEGQRRLANAVRDRPRVLVRAGHSVGKTAIAARLAAWWIDIHPPGEAMVVSTAPTTFQVRDLLWRELNRAHKAGNLAGRMNLTEWYVGGEIVALGRKPADYDPTSLQGYHAPNMLVIIDEAGGVPEELWKAADSLASAANGKLLAIGNPDDPDSHMRAAEDSGVWHTIQLSCFDTPAFTGENVPAIALRSLVSKRWVEEKRVEWGEGSPFWASKVLGQWPDGSIDSLIPESKIRSNLATPQPHIRRAGFDVASGGNDESVIWLMDGNTAVECQSWREPDAMKLAAEVAQWCDKRNVHTITVDVIGVGWGVHSRLDALHRNGQLQARPYRFHAAEKADDSERYKNMKAQAWWALRDLVHDEALNLTALDQTTIEDLKAHRFGTDAAGRIIIESKDDVKKRLGRSPDHGDALIMACIPRNSQPHRSNRSLTQGRIA